MVQYGSSFIDVNGVRYLCMDFTVFTIHNATTSFVLDNNEHSGNPTEQLLQFRSRVTTWINQTLSDAKLKVGRKTQDCILPHVDSVLHNKGLSVWVVGHQPLNTKEGADEYDVNSANFAMLKELFQLYHDIIKVGLFGHINQAGLSEVLSSHYVPLFPSITAPGM